MSETIKQNAAAGAARRASLAQGLAWGVGPILLGLILTTLALVAVGADPAQAYRVMWTGAFGDPIKFGNVIQTWVPLLLCSIGLLITFTAGLWNIGVEGQIILGAVFTAWAARALDLPTPVLLPILFLAGAIGGALWALLAGVLKTFGQVHEIFGGLGLNFIATAVSLYLILGPWKLPGIASTSGTELFRKTAWLPTFSGGLSVGPVEVGVSLVALVVVYLALRGTLWGLKLKAIGKNTRSAYWLGIRTNVHMLGAFALCGAFAGMAGTVQAIGVWHRLIPSISGGYGYLGILVVLLAGFKAIWLAPVAFFFSAVTKGSVALPLDLQIDSSLGGVLQGIIVLMVVLGQGVRSRLERARALARRQSPPVQPVLAPPSGNSDRAQQTVAYKTEVK